METCEDIELFNKVLLTQNILPSGLMVKELPILDRWHCCSKRRKTERNFNHIYFIYLLFNLFKL